MSLLTWLADIFAGGKKRRLARAVRRLRRAFENRDADEPHRRARLYGHTMRLAMRIQPSEAHDLSRSYDADIADSDYQQAFSDADRDWLRRHVEGAGHHALAACLQIAHRLHASALSELCAHRLADTLAQRGDADKFIAHLEACRRRGSLTTDMLSTSLQRYLVKHSLADDRETWLSLFAHIPADKIPDLFAVHALLGRSIDATRLAETPAQQRAAIELCLAAHFVDGATPGVALADELGDGSLRAQMCRHIGDLHAERDDDTQALHWYTQAGANGPMSECHERMGDLWEALRLCPASDCPRVCSLVDKCQPEVHQSAASGNFQRAVEQIGQLCTLLDQAQEAAGEGDHDRIGNLLDELNAHRQAVVASGSQHFRARLQQLSGPSDSARRDMLLDWSRFEESAGNLRAAGQRAEEADELYLAHRLYRAGEHYGDAIRALTRMRAESSGTSDEQVARDIAQALKDGGDFAGAGAAFRELRSYRDAKECYTRAGNFAAAAECVRHRMDADRPEESADWPEWLDLMGRAKAWVPLLEACLRAAQRQANRSGANRQGARADDSATVRKLRELIVEPVASVVPAALVSQSRVFLDSLQAADRSDFDRRVGPWIDRARASVDARYADIWGLDLGTTNCAVAIYDKEAKEPVLCPWKGAQQFPSTLGLDRDGREVVGLTQEQLLAPQYRASVYAAKRHIGQKKRFKLGERRYRPEEVAARLIAHARTIIEDFLARQVMDQVREQAANALGDVPADWLDRLAIDHDLTLQRPQAVVTIPAFFRNNQKHATRDACAIAGVEVKRLLHEPTAACLAANRLRSLGARVVVVDLGAGTLDLSAVEVDDKIQEVKQISGDTKHGGRDYDAAIYKTLKQKLRREHELDFDGDPTLRKRLELAAECLKIDLSLADNASYTLHGVGPSGARNISLTLSRSQMQDILAGPLDRLSEVCRSFVKELPWRPTDLVLVGGPVLAPLVRERIERAFERTATQVADPRLLVAQGAALQAAVLDGSIRHVLLLDVAPLPLGIQVVDDVKDRNPVFSELIPANTTIPVHREHSYSTVEDNQPMVAIRIYQGELSDEGKLGEFHLEDIAPAKAGEPQIAVSFDINADCVLTVTAEEQQPGQKNGRKKSVTIHDTTLLSPNERDRMAARFAAQHAHRAQRARLQAVRTELAAALRDARQNSLTVAACAWKERLDARRFPMEPDDPDAQTALFEMFNSGADVEVQAQRWQARIDDLTATVAAFIDSADSSFKKQSGQQSVDAASRASGDRDAGDYESRIAAAAGYRDKLQALLDGARPTRDKLAAWTRLLTRLATHLADPLQRFVACHDVGDIERALDAYAKIKSADVTESLRHRHLDCIATSGRAEDYRSTYLSHRERLGADVLDPARLERFVERVADSIGWVQGCTSSGQRFVGSAFLVSDRLLATNQHVVLDDPAPGSAEPTLRQGGPPAVAPEALQVHVAGRLRTIAAIHLPERRELDVALLELAEPCSARPLRLGYDRLARVGQLVVALGFPWSNPERSFEENFEVQAGVINKFETQGESAIRFFKVGIRIGPGMSGGPVFNDLGEVIGLVTLGKLSPLATGGGPAHYVQSSYALAIEPLRALVPAPWSASDGVTDQ